MTADIQQENSIWRKVLLLAADKFDQMSGPDALGENNQHAGGRRFFCLSPFSLFLQFFSGGGKYMPALSHIIANIRQTFIVLNCFWQTFIIIPLYCTFILINVFFSR